MIQQFPTIVNDFSKGFMTKLDPTDLPLGAAQAGQNVILSDDSKISPSKGAELFGAMDSSGIKVTSAFNFRKSDGAEIPLRASGTVLEYYHSGTMAWENLNSGYTSGQVFGFREFNEGLADEDQLVFGNNVEPYSIWRGSITQLNGALVGGEATVTVDSVLTSKVHFSGTSILTTATTIDIATPQWGTNLWNTFYVRITSGPQTGKISLISATTATQITFAAIAGLAGTPTFEIRQIAFNASGTIRIGTTNVTYTALTNDNTFNGAVGTPAAADNAAVAMAVQEFPLNPRGNIFETQNGRMFVAADDNTVVFVSRVGSATDFTFTTPVRLPGEGDIVNFVEGGGAITGMGIHEDVLHILKKDFIKTLSYTQDANDLANTAPVISSNLVGPISTLATFKVDNSLFFASAKGGIKTLQRVANINFNQTLQIADPIRPTVNEAIFDQAAGIFFDERAFITAKRNSSSTFNDIIFVFNFQKNAWELPRIGINISDFFIFNNELYGVSSTDKEAFKLETGRVIKRGTDSFPIKASWTSGSITYGKPANRTTFQSLYVEGLISPNTDLFVTISYEFRGIFRQLNGVIRGTNNAILLQSSTTAGFALIPLGVGVLGAGDVVPEGLNKFRTYIQLNEIPAYEVAVTFESDGLDQVWEVLRFGFNDIEYKQIDPSIQQALT